MNKKLCIVVPYRDRESHLKEFLPSIKKTLSDQKIDYHVLIVEQADNKPFNRAKLLNIGFDFTKGEYDYYCFHDVDMLPEKTDYSYCSQPTHLAVEVEQFGYKLAYDAYFGGVTIFDRESFQKINGYSNEYYGWGAEDDDVFGRCSVMHIPVNRKNCRYSSLHHERSINQTTYQKNLERLRSFHTSFDGSKLLEGLNTLKYDLKSEEILEENVTLIKTIL